MSTANKSFAERIQSEISSISSRASSLATNTGPHIKLSFSKKKKKLQTFISSGDDDTPYTN